jgi:hypothetical protein
MSRLVVIGTSPFADGSIACGVYRSWDKAIAVSQDLAHKGWITEIAELQQPQEIDTLTNDEGADS